MSASLSRAKTTISAERNLWLVDRYPVKNLTAFPLFSFSNMAKIPRDLAGRLVHLDSEFCRIRFKLPEGEARLRARREFRFFPAEMYLTEIDRWQEMPDGYIEFTVKRLRQRRPAPR
jgi:hypothetical protein